jgi:hypothetical protein
MNSVIQVNPLVNNLHKKTFKYLIHYFRMRYNIKKHIIQDRNYLKNYYICAYLIKKFINDVKYKIINSNKIYTNPKYITKRLLFTLLIYIKIKCKQIFPFICQELQQFNKMMEYQQQ